MEGISTTPYKPHELLEAGASQLFILYYEECLKRGIETNARTHIESEHRSLEDVAANPAAGGGFFASLWNNDPRYGANSPNPYGADGTNSDLLAAAGVPPYDQ